MKRKDIETLNRLFDTAPDKRTPAEKRLLKELNSEWEQEQAKKDHDSWVANQPI